MIFKSLQVKLMALVVAIVVVSNVAVALIARTISSNTMSDTVHSLLDSVTNDVAGTVEDEMSKQFRLFDGIARIDFIMDESISFEEKCRRLTTLNGIGSEYENITYYSKEGDNMTKDGRIVHLTDREYIKQAAAGKKYISDPFFSSVANTMLQTYSVPVKNERGTIIGIIGANTYGEQLMNIQGAIESVVEASSHSSEAFQSVTDKIRETDELVRQISAAMQEQNEGSQQISAVLHTMNDSSLEVRNAGKEMMEGNKAILSEVRNLQDATGVIQSSMEEMSVGARKINETGEALHGISEQVKKSIEEIGEQIDKFTV